MKLKVSPIHLLLINALHSKAKAVTTAGSLRGLQGLQGKQGPGPRDKSIEECTLLMKITRFEGDIETEDIECEDGEGIYALQGLDNADKDDIIEKIKKGVYASGRDILKVPGSKVMKGKLDIGKNGARVEKRIDKGRRLAVTTGQKETLALWVGAADTSTSTTPRGATGSISDEIFGTHGDTINLRSQYNSCSFDQVDFFPAEGPSTNGPIVSEGVFDVQITESVTGVNNSIIRSAVQTAATNVLGNLPSQYDHVMMCLPPGTSGGWIAYAYLNHWLSVYNDQWCNYPSGQMHELGHNLNLAHAGEGTAQYDDQSGMMGYSYSSDEGPVMCFNAPKNWQLGWYSDRHITVSPDYSWSGRIYGIASYGVTSTNEKMIVRMDDPSNPAGDIYISFNAKIGVNAGSLEGGNQVLIHSKVADVNSFGQSWLLHKMTTGVTQSVTINGQSVPITVVAINTGAAIPYADIQIGTLNPTEAPTDSLTMNPTKSPTINPTNAPSLLPTESPTSIPSQSPSTTPSTSPSKEPSKAPSTSPTKTPTTAPTKTPTNSPTDVLTINPTKSPSGIPSKVPTPTNSPSSIPTKALTATPTDRPSISPTMTPSTSPSASPIKVPTSSPTMKPSSNPTTSPTDKPTTNPTMSPTKVSTPTISPTKTTTNPTISPTSSPTVTCASQRKFACRRYSNCEWWGRYKECRPVNGPSPTPPPGGCTGLNKNQCKAAGCYFSNRFKTCY